MQSNFDPIAYATFVGEELVSSFARAGMGTTPDHVGSAREASVRERLASLLPASIAVGSGCVIDSHGGTSRQMDVVLHEKHICPVYSLNKNDPSATYYPCEGVIAVGEIKSDMTSRELEDTFAKIVSVKRLRRVDGLELGTPAHFDQTFSFALAGSLALQPATLCTKYAEMSALHRLPLSPDLIVTLDGNHVLAPLMSASGGKWNLGQFAHESHAICCTACPEGSFVFLLARIYTLYRQGRVGGTVARVVFDRYFTRGGRLKLPINGPVVSLR